MVVLDCSVALSWMLPDETSILADELLSDVSKLGALVPRIFRLEVGSALVVAVRDKRISAEYRVGALERISALRLSIDADGDDQVWTDCIDLAERHGLSLYDASYLELAKRRNLPIATLDRRLGDAARKAGIPSAWPQA